MDLTTTRVSYFLIFNRDSTVQFYRVKAEWTTSIFSSLQPYFHWSSCLLVCEGRSRPDTAVARLTCEIPARWIFPRRHLSYDPSVGAHEHSRRPIASVKSVSSAALWFSDPNLPHIPTTTTPLCPRYTVPPQLPQHVVIHSPFFLSALRQSGPKSLYICSTWLLPSVWPTKWLGSLLRSIYHDSVEGDGLELLFSLMSLWILFPRLFFCADLWMLRSCWASLSLSRHY